MSSSSTLSNQLFRRELGVPIGFNRNPPPPWGRNVKFRQVLMAARMETTNNVADQVIVPASFVLPFDSSPSPTDKQKDKVKYKSDWVKLEPGNAIDAQVGCAENLIWSRCLGFRAINNEPIVRPPLEQFCSFSPFNFEMTIRMRREMCDHIIAAIIIQNRTGKKPRQTTSFMMTLNEYNQIRVYDLIDIRPTTHINLSCDITTPSVHSFSSMELSKNDERIFVFGTDVYKSIEAIVIFLYPPICATVGILYTNNINILRCAFHHGLFGLLNKKHELHILCWNDLQKNAVRIPATRKIISPVVLIQEERRLISFPESKMFFKYVSVNHGILNFHPPIFYTTMEHGVGFYDASTSQLFNYKQYDQPNQHQLIHRIHNWNLTEDNQSIVFPFPDSTQRALVINQTYNANIVLEFKENFRGFNVDVNEIYSFGNEHNNNSSTDEHEENEQSQTTHNNVKCVLGMDYSEQLNLLAVLFAYKDNQFFSVTLYDPFDLKEFQTLPLVKVDEFIMEGNVVFAHGCLLIECQYSTDDDEDEDDRKMHVFLCRLFSEKIFLLDGEVSRQPSIKM